MDRHAPQKGLYQDQVSSTEPEPFPPGCQAALPRVGVTIGDPAGVGPELIRKVLDDDGLRTHVRIRVLGDWSGHEPGRPTVRSARAAWDALEESVELLKSGSLDAVVTCPISKSQMRSAGFPFPGHTEFYAERFRVTDYAMVLTSAALTVSPVTIHLPLAKALEELSTAAIVRTGRLLAEFLLRLGKARPRVAVAGLNPHAGEKGLLGTDEEEIICPAIELLREAFPGGAFSGPESPDTVYYRAVQGEFDAVVGMYHDQALIPLKMVGFHDGVNVTAGLPYPRTSPDHGTAFHLAGKGAARADSLTAAVRLAARLAQRSQISHAA